MNKLYSVFNKPLLKTNVLYSRIVPTSVESCIAGVYNLRPLKKKVLVRNVKVFAFKEDKEKKFYPIKMRNSIGRDKVEYVSTANYGFRIVFYKAGTYRFDKIKDKENDGKALVDMTKPLFKMAMEVIYELCTENKSTFPSLNRAQVFWGPTESTGEKFFSIVLGLNFKGVPFKYDHFRLDFGWEAAQNNVFVLNYNFFDSHEPKWGWDVLHVERGPALDWKDKLKCDELLDLSPEFIKMNAIREAELELEKMKASVEQESKPGPTNTGGSSGSITGIFKPFDPVAEATIKEQDHIHIEFSSLEDNESKTPSPSPDESAIEKPRGRPPKKPKKEPTDDSDQSPKPDSKNPDEKKPGSRSARKRRNSEGGNE